ncbi:hypothetical protein [Salinarimonas rosea]|uniref:hypothetical protein n=1 Tax=Salinarimonas rosea TaxID=552063 RepID=UPI00040503D3|nr:hypothetical protein [Salinarimonas rosea]
MRRRSIVALLVYLPTNAVLFGLGAVTILLVPALNARADVLFPVVVVASFVLAAPIAWALAPRLQARAFRRGAGPPDDAPSAGGVAKGGGARRD